MIRVRCMCGVDLTISEASSGWTMIVETHECKGWPPPAMDIHVQPSVLWVPEQESGDG